VAQSDIGQPIGMTSLAADISNLASDNFAKNGGEIKRNFRSTKSIIPLMNSFTITITLGRRAAPKSAKTPAMVLVAKRREEDERFRC
jgi:hypothetical protein